MALLLSVLTVLGLLQAIAGWLLVRHVTSLRKPDRAALAPISVLKPLYGDEPLLEEALASLCTQNYPCFQVVFGVQNHSDAALATVARLQARFPECDIAVVVDGSAPGRNRKVANLCSMFPAARHDLLVIADSDVHAEPDYLHYLAAALSAPGIGLATTLYTGLPAAATLVGRLGAGGITHSFLPGAALGRALGRQDALGATLALRRETLAAIGGFAALRDELADDNVMGRRVRELGLGIGLAATIPATTVPETTLTALFQHELRWARTIRAISPLAFVASSVQYPLVWAMLAWLFAGFSVSATALVLVAWGVRAVAARGIDRALALTGERAATLWHLPLRDLMSMGVLLVAHAGNKVEWRGQKMRAGRPAKTLATEQLGIERI